MSHLILLGWFFYAFLSDGGGHVFDVRRVGLFPFETACEETRVALRERLIAVEPTRGWTPQVSPRCVPERDEDRRR